MNQSLAIFLLHEHIRRNFLVIIAGLEGPQCLIVSEPHPSDLLDLGSQIFLRWRSLVLVDFAIPQELGHNHPIIEIQLILLQVDQTLSYNNCLR